MQRGTHQSDAAREKISAAQKARWHRDGLRREVALAALALKAEDSEPNKLRLTKALAELEAEENTVAGAVGKALAGRNPVVNLLADDSVQKALASDDPDDLGIHGITERNRLRKSGATARRKTTLNTAQADLEKPIPKLNMGPYDPAKEEG
jgi:hypothetical protein